MDPQECVPHGIEKGGQHPVLHALRGHKIPEQADEEPEAHGKPQRGGGMKLSPLQVQLDRVRIPPVGVDRIQSDPVEQGVRPRAEIVFRARQGIVGVPGQLHRDRGPPEPLSRAHPDLSFLPEAVPPSQERLFEREADPENIRVFRSGRAQIVLEAFGDLFNRFAAEGVFSAPSGSCLMIFHGSHTDSSVSGPALNPRAFPG